MKKPNTTKTGRFIRRRRAPEGPLYENGDEMNNMVQIPLDGGYS